MPPALSAGHSQQLPLSLDADASSASTSRSGSYDRLDRYGDSTTTLVSPTVRPLKSASHGSHSRSVATASSSSSSPIASTAAHSRQTQIKRRTWSQEDINSLVSILNEVDGRSWTEISRRAFPHDEYSSAECQEKWKELSKEKKDVNRGAWTHEEDQALMDAVERFRPEKWVVIATQVGARNGKQCRERWYNHLSPDIKKGTFSAEEDEIIFHWYSIVGSKWSEIAKHLPGRPDNMIKNHFNTSLQRQKRRLRHNA
ncbi:hypothetical protein P389DRAFT_143428, partial [Cystobasidium minutum MCA 4210]|uniref:uncharacterized protein n=1 Tax=Cystobasidium minutum MCA 4210 TaxID=1397322 RepID=UPI0034CF663D|eukprot:jgi/Rhomi1/143428/e_gw1.4.134.1